MVQSPRAQCSHMGHTDGYLIRNFHLILPPGRYQNDLSSLRPDLEVSELDMECSAAERDTVFRSQEFTESRFCQRISFFNLGRAFVQRDIFALHHQIICHYLPFCEETQKRELQQM